MEFTLFNVEFAPDRIAVCGPAGYITGGVFFLDFSRPLQEVRTLFGKPSRFGRLQGWCVPVIHQLEKIGGFVIAVHRHDTIAPKIHELWKHRFPSKEVSGSNFEPIQQLQVIADFARTFPETVD